MAEIESSPPAATSLGAFSSVELRHLAALDAVAEEGTFGRAARRLGYTQSAVSQQIAALERAIGASVFDRPGGPRPVRLTPLGKLVLEHARELLAKAATTAQAIERFQAGEAGRVDVGTFQSVSAVLLPVVLQRLRHEFPGADIRLYEDEATALPKVASGDLDLAFTCGPTRSDLAGVALLDDPYVLVARRGEFPKGAVRAEDLDGLSMIGFPPTCDMNRIEPALNALGVRPIKVFETADNGTLLAMVRAGMGPAVVALLCVDIEADDEHLELHTLIPPIEPRTIELAWRADHPLSPLAERFRDVTVEVCRELAPREAEYYALAG